MISKSLFLCARELACVYYEKASVVLTEEEKNKIEIADFGLNDLMNTGLQLLTYINTERVCSKEMVLFPFQTCPEHRHPALNGKKAKEETFRCRYGTVYLYINGSPSEHPVCTPPEGTYTVFHEIKLSAGEQYTIQPETVHWFQAGSGGAVISEFSTHSDDNSDVFTDKRIVRTPTVL